jgi:predicted RecA/RadA family phage recombinase
MAHLLTSASTLMCPHGGTVTITTSNSRSMAAGTPLVRAGDTFTVAGCPFVLPGGAPHPCVRVQWIQSTTRDKAGGDAALNEQSVGLCQAADQAPQGTVQVVVTQPRVAGR